MQNIGEICGPSSSPKSLRTKALGSRRAAAFWGAACLLGAQYVAMLPATLGDLCQKLLLKYGMQPDLRKMFYYTSTQGHTVFLPLQSHCGGVPVPRNITFLSPCLLFSFFKKWLRSSKNYFHTLLFLCLWMLCQHVCTPLASPAHAEAKTGGGSPGTGVPDSCEPHLHF